ncbi:hypothetical protein MLD38_006999 [Melastoma candidum]|uniref:Uncharacterized protein n=1 Tax=Melastoma candidum TaxID=119954 RepID=A0ACB9RPN2_9MYRT|nr:hypothetical protein MLD38_006999 [Melastoma candidum]
MAIVSSRTRLHIGVYDCNELEASTRNWHCQMKQSQPWNLELDPWQSFLMPSSIGTEIKRQTLPRTSVRFRHHHHFTFGNIPGKATSTAFSQ